MANNSTSFAVVSNSLGLCLIGQKYSDATTMVDLPDSADTTRTLLLVFNGIACPPIVVINAIVILAVLGDEELRSSSYNFLLVFLAVTDFLVGLLVAPIFLFYLRCLTSNCHSPCTLPMYFLSAVICCGLTILTLTLASLERYVAIEHPNWYRKMVRAKIVMIGTIICWAAILTLLACAAVFISQSHAPILFKVAPSVLIGISSLVILYCSIKVQVTAYRQRRTIDLQQASVQQYNEQQQQQQRLQEYKRVFTLTLLLVGSVVFYSPFIVATVIKARMGEDAIGNVKFKYVVMPICVTLIHLQSLLNPILVSLRLSYIRKSIKNKLRALFNVQN